MALITLADLKTYLGITGTAEDALLTGLLEAASAAVERLCDRTFTTAIETRWFEQTALDKEFLYLDADLMELIEVQDAQGTVYRSEVVLVGQPVYGMLLQGRRWQAPVMVNGVWGYAAATAGTSGIVARAYTVTSVVDRMLYLDADLMSITNVTNGDGVVLGGAAYTLFPSAAPYRAITLKADAELVWTGTIQVFGTWRTWIYAVLPAVQQACKEWAAAMYASYNAEQQVAGDVPLGVERLLQPYMRLR